ncbi:hypothetical protein [Paenibacillus sp. RC67]|nr:hypothetical protein [Paenibacillus sp. RC67]
MATFQLNVTQRGKIKIIDRSALHQVVLQPVKETEKQTYYQT